ncbi:MAG: HNH endonuclease [Actinobacteria bacterium]|nr:HNH endonuclease [Actinomycetota bacterium]
MREQLVEAVPQLLRHAAGEPASRFREIVRDWVNLVDQDGSDSAARRALEQRSATLSISDHGFVLQVVGPTADGVELRAALRERCRIERAADWAACKAQHGDQACPALMPRTDRQRRYDALMELLGARTDAVVNYMVDARTFDRTAASLFGAAVTDDAAGPDDLRRWCSRTTDGTFVPPAEIVLAAIRGRIRVVVTDDRGVVLHMGRLRRLFTGPMREAVLMSATRCTHPGCETPSGDAQADHLLPHSRGGATATVNGAPACGTHNRWRYTTGARTMLDDEGYWRTYRSDGTEVA